MKRETFLKINKITEEIARLEKYSDNLAINFQDNRQINDKIVELKKIRAGLFFKEKISEKLSKNK